VKVLGAEEFAKDGFHFILAGYVTAVSRCPATGSGYLPAGFIRIFSIHVEDTESSAMRRESEGDGSPDATSSSGHYGNLAIEAETPGTSVRIVQSETPLFQGMKSA
jgi:hypothetical protein